MHKNNSEPEQTRKQKGDKKILHFFMWRHVVSKDWAHFKAIKIIYVISVKK